MRLMHPARGPSLCRRGSCIWDGISGIAPRPLRRWGEKGGVPAAVRQLRQKNIKALGPLLRAGQVVQVCKRTVVPGQLRRLPGGSAICTAVEQGPFSSGPVARVRNAVPSGVMEKPLRMWEVPKCGRAPNAVQLCPPLWVKKAYFSSPPPGECCVPTAAKPSSGVRNSSFAYSTGRSSAVRE